MNNIDENFKFEENRSKLKISFERISFIFFIFFIITIIFTSKTIYLGFKKINQTQTVKEKEKYRASIMDRNGNIIAKTVRCLLYTSPSPRDVCSSRMPSSA